MIHRNEIIKDSSTITRENKLEKAFSSMLQKYLSNGGVVSLRSGLGSKEICEDGTLCYKGDREGSMQFQYHELLKLVKQAVDNGFTVNYKVNSHNVGFYHISL